MLFVISVLLIMLDWKKLGNYCGQRSNSSSRSIFLNLTLTIYCRSLCKVICRGKLKKRWTFPGKFLISSGQSQQQWYCWYPVDMGISSSFSHWWDAKWIVKVIAMNQEVPFLSTAFFHLASATESPKLPSSLICSAFQWCTHRRYCSMVIFSWYWLSEELSSTPTLWNGWHYTHILHTALLATWKQQIVIECMLLEDLCQLNIDLKLQDFQCTIGLALQK